MNSLTSPSLLYHVCTTLCALSFIGTLAGLTITFLDRRFPGAKTRVIQLGFSFVLTSVIVISLAQTKPEQISASVVQALRRR